MKKYLLTPIMASFFIACGGGGSSSSTTSAQENTNTELSNSGTGSTTTTNTATDNSSSTPTNTANLKIALDNTGSTLEKSFNDYVLKIIVSELLAESNETSQGTIAVYGTINGDATESLLKINTNYVGQSIYVAVYKDESLIAQSETFEVSNTDPINFGEITIN